MGPMGINAFATGFVPIDDHIQPECGEDIKSIAT
jgi:hypothetical protein